MTAPLSIVLSRSRYDEPARRTLAEALAAALTELPGVQVLRLPHLYDLTPDGPAVKTLRSVPGDLVICAWLYPRAAFWVLDANGIGGRMGTTTLAPDEEQPPHSRGRPANHPAHARSIWCLDLRTASQAEPYVAEVERILRETGRLPAEALPAAKEQRQISESSAARWYPVIDYARCTNCLECLNFCLFGVFGLDHEDLILVEQADACRAGCPACSRICPADAILFPQHGDPAIAGDHRAAGAAKPSLTQWIGSLAPDQLAQLERSQALALQQDDPLSRLVDAIDRMELEGKVRRMKDEG